jgi:hypothetical protein
MPYCRKELSRLALVFGISAASYGVAAILATHARDNLIAHLEMRQTVAHAAPTGGTIFTAIPVADR